MSLLAGLFAIGAQAAHVRHAPGGHLPDACPLQQTRVFGDRVHDQAIIGVKGKGIVSNLAFPVSPQLLAVFRGAHGEVQAKGLGEILRAGEPGGQCEGGDVALGGGEQATGSALHTQAPGKSGNGLADHRLENTVEVEGGDGRRRCDLIQARIVIQMVADVVHRLEHGFAIIQSGLLASQQKWASESDLIRAICRCRTRPAWSGHSSSSRF